MYKLVYVAYITILCIVYLHLLHVTRTYGENLSKLRSLHSDVVDAYRALDTVTLQTPFDGILIEDGRPVWMSEKWDNEHEVMRMVDLIPFDKLFFESFPDIDFITSVTVFYKTKIDDITCVIYMPTV